MLTIRCRGISLVLRFSGLPWGSVVSGYVLWSPSLCISWSLPKCQRNISKLQHPMKFLFKSEIEKTPLKGTKPFTSRGVLALELYCRSNFPHSVGKESNAFEVPPSPTRYSLCWDLPEREVLSSESWLLGSDCLDETQCMRTTLGGQVCFSCSCSCKVKILARQAVWAEFWTSDECAMQRTMHILFKGPQDEHMERLLWAFKWPYCTAAFRCQLTTCKRTCWFGNVLGNHIFDRLYHLVANKTQRMSSVSSSPPNLNGIPTGEGEPF